VTARPVRVTAGYVASATGGSLLSGHAEMLVEGISIDTRTMRPGDLFVAIRGDRFDGNAFAGQALAQGACGVVVSEADAARSVTPGGSAPAIILVADTTAALQALARMVRRDALTRVVAITGSAGKTTTKEIAADLLATRYRVHRTQGNLNNHIGLPLSLLDLRSGPDVAVVELGMSHAGEIRTLVGIAEPDVRVWTNVAEVHAEFFPTLEAIADAKAEILEHAGPGTLLVANANDPLVMVRARAFAGRLVTFGLDVAADIEARAIHDRGLSGTSADIRTPRGAARFDVPLPGRANLANVLAAAAVALELGIPLAVIAERVRSLVPASRRGEVWRLSRGVTLVDDSYNSNPRALCQALDVIGAEPAATRRVAVLGEMLELGEQAVALHRLCGRVAARARLAVLMAVGGPAAQALADTAEQEGVPAVSWVGTSEQAADLAAHTIRSGDLVLVKGSRGIRTDLVADRIKAEFA
jgi:UDP-N-acetylmuramoyl-tripeptide--D-alanyl-D-alanine ligase